MIKKSFIVSFVLSVALITSTQSHVVAKDDTKMNILITSNLIDVQIPLVTTFHLGEEDVYPDITFTNNTNAHVDFIISGVTHGEHTTTDIVAPNTYSDEDWYYLSAEDTNKYMALGIYNQRTLETKWLNHINSFRLDTLEPNSSNVYNMISKHGNRWYDDTIIAYEISIKVEISSQ